VPFELTLVPATRAHVPAIFEMVRELADYERLTHLVTGSAQDLENELFGARPIIEAIVALSEAAPVQDRAPNLRAVGFALYFHNFSTFLARRGLYLEDLYVKPGHRRRGYGTALLKRVAAIAHERGCGRFEWSVLDWNKAAIDFYERHGASVLPDWRIARVTGPALARLAGR
jgi:GNAT superfamily N-acetyltransferase